MTITSAGRSAVALAAMLCGTGAYAQSVLLGKTISARFDVETSLFKDGTLINHGIVPVEATVSIDGAGRIYDYEGGRRVMAMSGRMSKGHLWTLSESSLSSLSVSPAADNTITFSAQGEDCAVDGAVRSKEGLTVKVEIRTSFCRISSGPPQQ